MPDRYKVGTIVNTHGVRGEVRVIATTDFPAERFAKGSQLIVETTPPTPVTVASARKHKQFTLLTFTEFADMDAVLPFKGHDLSVPAAAVKPLTEPDTYYYRDIIGLTVIDDTGATLGKVSEILTPGPNDVWVIPRPGKPDILLPFLKSVVTAIDLDAKVAHVVVPEGLIDDAD
ncbi:ribosome maturation factor RimM [Lacticaseibacillus nasuensis]|nr:ribosome maturation factor RimM [Lacticaseibacillus nasuensis]MCX2455951.1 ribosome maturation factor RimM [Lacticaseibacillus nasuensis]